MYDFKKIVDEYISTTIDILKSIITDDQRVSILN